MPEATTDRNRTMLRVRAPSRVHWGLLNESGLDGWIDGGLGMGLSIPCWEFDIATGDWPKAPDSSGAGLAIRHALTQLARSWGGPEAYFELSRRVNFHTGLGARTSLLLAAGKAYATLMGKDPDTQEIANLLRRGRTSGIGTQVSDRPGIVTDWGHPYPGAKGDFGPSSANLSSGVARPGMTYPVPNHWRVVLLLMPGLGLHGTGERIFFEDQCPVPDAETIELLARFEEFQDSFVDGSVTHVHRLLEGMQEIGLKRREWAIQPRESLVLRSIWQRSRQAERSLSPLCLTSMGPTLFLVTESPERELSELARVGLPSELIVVSKPAESGVLFTSGRRIEGAVS